MAEANMKVVREYAIENGLTPTGRKVGISKVANTSLIRLSFVDEKPGKLPAPYDSMMYTRTVLAQEDLKKYLVEQWDHSDSVAAKSVKAAQEEALATNNMIKALTPKNATATAE